nr:hypothetical protein [Tanacetum cinerariifolium]
MPAVKPKVLAPGMYVIDVEPIPPHNRNNTKVHLDYLKHLKESVATLREILKEDRVEKLFDSSLASACRYTKHSQELVKQEWQAIRKLFATVGHQWWPIGRKFTLGERCPLTRITISKVVPVNQVTPPLDNSVTHVTYANQQDPN